MAGSYALTGLALPDSLERLQALLAQVRRDHPELEELDVSMLETAVVEIHGNVIEHAAPHGGVRYAFEVEVRPRAVVGHLVDTGDAPDLSARQFSDRPGLTAESGRGLWLANAVLDDLQYRRVAGRNTWRLVRTRRDAGAADDPHLPEGRPR